MEDLSDVESDGGVDVDRDASRSPSPPPPHVDDFDPHPARFRVNGEIFVQENIVHPELPITAPDYSYIMDIFDMRSLLMDRHDREVDADPGLHEIIDRVARLYRTHPPPALNNRKKFLLVFLDTTSRKAWAYPMETKGKDETWRNFKKFMRDVHNKIARLLSDNDKAFNEIKEKNTFFTYCLITASHNNHKTLGLIDRFARTLRHILYKIFRNYVNHPSWYENYQAALNSYNNAKHRGLELYGRSRTGNYHKFHYTPNQVWFNPRLRSRIRLRHYFQLYDHYMNPNLLFQRILNAPRVRVRVMKNNVYNQSRNYFSNQAFRKGIKRGNAWFVNGR